MKVEKVKVCFALMGAYPLFNPSCSYRHGGTEVRLYTLAKELAKDEHFEVNFIVGDFGQNEKEVYDNIQVYKGIDIYKKKLSYAFEVFKFFKLMKKKDDDIYITACANLIVGVVAFYTRIFRKKFVFMTASRIDVDKSFINNSKFKGLIYKYGLHNCDLIITQNMEDGSLLKANHNKLSMLLKNPINIKYYSNGVKKKYFLWISSSQKLKQPEIFLKIAKAFPSEKFVMVMPENDPKLFQKIKSETHHIKNLVFIEHIPYSKINIIFKYAKAFINTSTYEGFPNTFLQAAVNKTPIVSLNVNPDNFITTYHCGDFADGDYSLMIAQIQELINNEEKLRNMGDNAREYVKNNHDLNVIVDQFKKVL